MNTPDFQEIANKFEIVEKVGSYDELLSFLAQRLQKVRGENPEKLFQMFYLLDVSEAKVAHALENSNAEDVYTNLATLIIDREVQRIKARKL